MHRRRTQLLISGLLVAPSIFLAACGEEDGASSDTTTTTTPAEPCAEVYTPGSGQAEGPDAVEARGEPQLQACEPAGFDLQVVDEVVGTGAEVPQGATIKVHYSGAAAATGVVFDSSWSRGAPISVGLGEVIPGWAEGLVGMAEGGRRTLVVPPRLAYGESGPAPGDALIFTVDLVSVDATPDAAGATTTSAG